MIEIENILEGRGELETPLTPFAECSLVHRHPAHLVTVVLFQLLTGSPSLVTVVNTMSGVKS